MKFKNIFKRLFKAKSKYGKIKFAFEHNGVDYYCFDDINMMPAERALMVFTVYNELDMRCDRNFLIEFKKSLDASINGKFLRTDIAQLSMYLGERLELTLETDLLLKLASVFYFDKFEDVTKYDFAYASEKIKSWKKGDINAFFLKKPIGELINLQASSKLDFRTYSELISQIKEVQDLFQSELQFRNNLTADNVKK